MIGTDETARHRAAAKVGEAYGRYRREVESPTILPGYTFARIKPAAELLALDKALRAYDPEGHAARVAKQALAWEERRAREIATECRACVGCGERTNDEGTATVACDRCDGTGVAA